MPNRFSLSRIWATIRPILSRLGFCLTGLLATTWLATSCHRKAGPAPSPRASAAEPAPKAPPLPEPLPRFAWSPLRDLGAIGVPDGCSLTTPVLTTPLPKGTVRFVAPPGGVSELLLAIDENGDGIVDREGVLDDHGVPGRALPWSDIDAPPVVARSASGWMAFDTEDLVDGSRRALVWREPGRVEELARGDRLEVVDAACDGATCGVLTTLASASAGPGASLFMGDSRAPASGWQRTDVPGEDKGFVPLSMVQLSAGKAWAALSAPGAVIVSRIDSGRATSVGRIEAPFGAYDVVLGAEPIVVAPGESIDAPCVKDGFSLNLLRAGQKRFEIDGQVPPSSVVSRPLAEGFIVTWLAPESCKRDARQTVRAFLVGPDGAPASSTMAMADAKGFALAARGAAVDVWLSTAENLIWLKASCHPRAAPLRTAEH